MFFEKKDNNKMQQSPIKQDQIRQLDDSQRDKLNDLQNLFTYYASEFSRHNYQKLHHKSYVNIMKKILNKNDSLNLQEQKKIDEKLKRIEVLYFSKGCKQGATFSQFLQMIPNIAKIVYPDFSNQTQTTKSITQDLLHLYQRQVQIKLNNKYINLDLKFQQETIKYILKLSQQFLKIYKSYFSHQIHKNKKMQDFKDQSMKCFVSFMKQFQVFPKLITASGICFIYKSVLDNQQTKTLDQQLKDHFGFQDIKDYSTHCGKLFTLGKMISALVAISKIASQKIKSEQQQSFEKDGFRALLQYIEMTKAYKKQRHLKDTGKSFSFILLQEYPRQFIKQSPKKDIAGKQITSKKDNSFIKMLKEMDF